MVILDDISEYDKKNHANRCTCEFITLVCYVAVIFNTSLHHRIGGVMWEVLIAKRVYMYVIYSVVICVPFLFISMVVACIC